MTVNIDMTTPTITCSGVDPIGAAQWRGEPATVSLHAADAGGSGVFYTNLYVGGVPTRYVMTPDVTRTIAVDGRSIISWQVYDRACNKSAMAMGELKIDLLPPITTVSGADDAWHSGPVTLTFSATDVHGKVAGSGVTYTEYRVGLGGTFGDWTRGTSVTVSGNGDHEVQYRSADKVGHVERPEVGPRQDRLDRWGQRGPDHHGLCLRHRLEQKSRHSDLHRDRS